MIYLLTVVLLLRFLSQHPCEELWFCILQGREFFVRNLKCVALIRLAKKSIKVFANEINKDGAAYILIKMLRVLDESSY